MKTVINNKKEITVDELVDVLQRNSNCIIFYMSNSSSGNEPYPVFLKKIKQFGYGFTSPIFCYNPTYEGLTIRDCIELAISGGKKLLFLERNEMSQLFKKIS